MRLLKILIVVILVAFAALAVYAYLGDMDAPQKEVQIPITTEAGGGQ